MTVDAARERLRQKVSDLEDEIEILREQLVQLRQILQSDAAFPPSWNLTQKQSDFLTLLMKKDTVSRDDMMRYWYCDALDTPGDGIVGVQLYHLRTKMRPLGVVIRSYWGRGWWLDKEAKKRVKSLIRDDKGNEDEDDTETVGWSI